MKIRLVQSAAMAAFVLGATSALSQPAASSAPCPDFLPAGTECSKGADENGAFYWIAKPKDWNGVLVVHSHGGPRLSVPEPDDALEDLKRFAVTVEEGYAWAGSNYRREGYGVRMAAEDTENLRKIAWQKLGKPKLTLLHGQSWGGNVAAKAAELYAVDGNGQQVYDGVVLTSGLLGGGSRGYDFRADLRAVYQFYCKNHPKPDEVQYPLWQGLPEGAKMTRKELEARVAECTGVDKPADQRSEQQKQNLANILGVIRIEETSLVAHLAWATNTFQDLVFRRVGGKNPFENQNVQYKGSSDDAALNAGVERFSADPVGARLLAYDSDLSGEIVTPVLTMHAIGDPTVFVEMENDYKATVEAVGNGDLLVQTFTDEAEHSKLATPQYAALFSAMVDWIEKAEKPTRASVDARCKAKAAHYKEECRFNLTIDPATLPVRSLPRQP